ncbi:MAG: hypothetical protein HC915_00480 [Anaerolineae bacterium]|nr:hypothetical protein [Anaerolineae bacterium]
MQLALALLALVYVLSSPGQRWRQVTALYLAGALTVGLSAAVLVPLALNSEYVAHPQDDGAGEAVDAGRVLQQFINGDAALYADRVAPGLPELYYSFILPPEFALLIGLIILPVPFFAQRSALDGAWRWWLAGVLIIAVHFIWGTGGNPLIAWLYQNVPGLGHWRFPGRALGMASFWVAVLVAMRADAIWRAILHNPWPRIVTAPPRFMIRTLQGVVAAVFCLASAWSAWQVLETWESGPDRSKATPMFTKQPASNGCATASPTRNSACISSAIGRCGSFWKTGCGWPSSAQPTTPSQWPAPSAHRT